jgi:hypothetical protein
MPRYCNVCHHPALKTVESDLLEGKLSLGEIGRRYGLSKSSLSRHRANCMGRRAVEAYLDHLQGIAERFGVSVEDILYHYEHCMGGSGHACACGQNPCAKEPPGGPRTADLPPSRE